MGTAEEESAFSDKFFAGRSLTTFSFVKYWFQSIAAHSEFLFCITSDRLKSRLPDTYVYICAFDDTNPNR